MKNQRFLKLAWTVCAVLAAQCAGAHDTNQLNRFSLNARIGFNITARFKDLEIGRASCRERV